MSNETQTSEYGTTDLYYAAYLQTAGAQMLRVDKEGASRLRFIFDIALVNLEELKNAWFNNSGRVAALPYANAIKSLKHICHMP